MSNIISLIDFEAYRNISENLGDERIDPFIAEAQEFDIKPALGSALYYAFVEGLAASPQTQIYLDLLDGKTYLDTGLNANISFKGVKAALVYYSYARLLMNNDLHTTAFGIVQKKNDYSESLDEKRIMRAVTQAQNSAKAYQNDFISFLDNEYLTYPLWSKKIESTTNKSSINISRITNLRSESRFAKQWCGSCHRPYHACNC